METGDNVLIGGFIITGTQPKRIIVRGIGSSLPFTDRLANPTLELHDSSGALVEWNDNWVDSPNAQAIIETTIPPSDDLESAIVATLPANNSSYTAIVRGASDGTGIGVVEAYDLDGSVDSKLANISTRGLVQTGDNVLIGGWIALGEDCFGSSCGDRPIVAVPGPLADPTLNLHDGMAHSSLLMTLEDTRAGSWNCRDGLSPLNDLESAILIDLVLAITPPSSVVPTTRLASQSSRVQPGLSVAFSQAGGFCRADGTTAGSLTLPIPFESVEWQ